MSNLIVDPRIVGRWRCPCGHNISGDPTLPPFHCDHADCACIQCRDWDIEIVDPDTTDPKLRNAIDRLVQKSKDKIERQFEWNEQRRRLVLVESPYAGDVERNLRYLRACLHDCFLRREYPFASHALYTQPGVLDDHDPAERALGIEAGLAWGRLAAKTVVYTDLGITPGMKLGIERAEAEGRTVEKRNLPNWNAQEKP
jgi:hypothetical protein